MLRVAALDSSRVPAAPLLVAEVDGQVRAILSLEDGQTIADPFFATHDLIALLRAHAAATRRTAPGLLRRLRLRSAA